MIIKSFPNYKNLFHKYYYTLRHIFIFVNHKYSNLVCNKTIYVSKFQPFSLCSSGCWEMSAIPTISWKVTNTSSSFKLFTVRFMFLTCYICTYNLEIYLNIHVHTCMSQICACVLHVSPIVEMISKLNDAIFWTPFRF